MNVADSDTAIRVVFQAAEEAASVAAGGLERRGNETRLIFITEATEDVVLVRELVVDANVEVGAVGCLHRIGKKVKAGITAAVRQWKERGKPRSQRIDQSRRNDIDRQSICETEWRSAKPGRITRHGLASGAC